MFGVNQGCHKQNLNESVLNRNVYLNSSNANEKTVMARQKSLHDPSVYFSVHVEEVVHNEPGESYCLGSSLE